MASKSQKSRGEKILRLVTGNIGDHKSEPPSAFVSTKTALLSTAKSVNNGRVWKPYKHEHDSFFRMIDKDTLKSLNDHFAFPPDRSINKISAVAPAQQSSSENNHLTHVADKIVGSCAVPALGNVSIMEVEDQEPIDLQLKMVTRVSSDPFQQTLKQPPRNHDETHVVPIDVVVVGEVMGCHAPVFAPLPINDSLSSEPKDSRKVTTLPEDVVCLSGARQTLNLPSHVADNAERGHGAPVLNMLSSVEVQTQEPIDSQLEKINYYPENAVSLKPVQRTLKVPSRNHHESHVAPNNVDAVDEVVCRPAVFVPVSVKTLQVSELNDSLEVITLPEKVDYLDLGHQSLTQISENYLESQVPGFEPVSSITVLNEMGYNFESPSYIAEYAMINSDDSVKDPDFDLDGDECLEPSDEENYTKENCSVRKKRKTQGSSSCLLSSIDNNVENQSGESEQPSRNKKKTIADPSAWRRNVVKKLRNEGQQYVPIKAKKKVVEAKKIRSPSCSEGCIHKCTEKFTMEEKQQLFGNYWKLGNVTRQREFITKHSVQINPEYRYPKGRSRQLNHAFYFSSSDGSKKRVCKNYFMATLDINRRTVDTAFRKEKNGVIMEDLRGKHKNHVRVSGEIRDRIRAHINSIPRIESHYLRKQTTREYIEGGKSVASLYRDYKKECTEVNKESGSLSMYTYIFNHEFNISFFVPKKDQCETCTVYSLADGETKARLKNEYELHQQEKELARLEKKWAKEFSNENVIVCCYDLQAAFPTPQGEASIFYYKSKLSNYNLSIYDLKTGETVNNVWHEGEANRGAVEIASCVYKFIEQKATSTNKKLKFVFFSDNCSGQQKNKFVLVMYMFCVRKFKNIRSISHKFLTTGHTQNEGDGVHSVIEKAVKRARKSGPIYVPSQFIQIIRTAKVKEPYYVVRELSFKDFIDFKTLTNCIGSNFNVNERGTKFPFTEIKSFMVTEDDPFKFYYRTSFDGELEVVKVWDLPPNVQLERNLKRKRNKRKQAEENEQDLLRRQMKIFDEFRCPQAYQSPTGISQNKMRDLLSLINSGVVPDTYRDFYKYLPIRETHTPKPKKSNKKKVPRNAEESETE